MANNVALILQTPGAMTGSTGIKLENYYGIEFVRNSSNGGGDNGYYQMIGDEDLIEELGIHAAIQPALVNDASVSAYLNPINFYQTEAGSTADLTGDDGSDVMIVYPDLYAIIGGTNTTYERYIFSDRAFSYGGDTAVKVASWGECPDYATVVNSVLRSITGASGSMGTQSTAVTGNPDDLYTSSTDYPRTSTTRFAFEQYARAKNDDTTSNAPYAPGNVLDYEVILALLYVEFRTKYLVGIFGNGISCNVTPTSSNWDTTSGCRLVDDDGNYVYRNLSSTASTTSGVYINGTLTTMQNILKGGTYSFLKIMQGQLGVSDGSLTLDAVYNSDGDAVDGYSNNVMTGVARFTSTFTINCAIGSSDTDAERECTLALMIPIWRGRLVNIGNINLWKSGYEVLNWYDDDNSVTVNTLFRAPSIDDLTTDSDSTTYTSAGNYGFENTYDEICDLGATTGWCTSGINFEGRQLACGLYDSSIGTAGSNNYESAYTSLAAGTSGSWIRKGSGFGGNADNTFAGPRICGLAGSPAYSATDLGGSFRVEIE